MARIKTIVSFICIAALGLAIGQLVRDTALAPMNVASAPQSKEASWRPGHAPHVPSPEAPQLSSSEPEIEPIGHVTAAVVPHARPEGEWQGMPVDMAARPQCATTRDCSESLACWGDGRCGPCRSDSECGAGEACVLDHCVAQDEPGCRSSADCAENEVCMLTRAGRSQVRHGPALVASCQSTRGGVDDAIAEARELEDAEEAEQAEPPPGPRSESPDPDALLGMLREGG